MQHPGCLILKGFRQLSKISHPTVGPNFFIYLSWWGLKSFLGVQANDEAEFSCVTEDGERLKTQLTVLTTNKRKERKKKEIVIKKVEFNEAASNKLVEDMFAEKPIDEFAAANQSEV